MNKKYLTLLVLAIYLLAIPLSQSLSLSNSSDLSVITRLNNSLNTCVSMYNNCSVDYHAGLNCGTFVDTLKENNQKLSDSRNFWMYGFYAISVLLVVTSLFLIISSILKNRKLKEVK